MQSAPDEATGVPAAKPSKRGAVIGAVVLACLVGMAALGIYVAYGGGREGASAEGESRADWLRRIEAESKGHASTSVYTIEEAYAENELAADRRFKDHWCKMHGLVAEVGRGLHGEPYVVLQGAKRVLGRVQCGLAAESVERAMALKPGAFVTLIGVGTGKLGNIRFSECLFVE